MRFFNGRVAGTFVTAGIRATGQSITEGGDDEDEDDDGNHNGSMLGVHSSSLVPLRKSCLPPPQHVSRYE